MSTEPTIGLPSLKVFGEQVVKEARATLFLGAGASRAFDFPTTKEFIEHVRESLGSKEKDLLNAFTETPGVSDVEHVLEILDQVAELENPLLKYLDNRKVPIPIQPFSNFSPAKWEEFKNVATSLRDGIRAQLFRQYEFDPQKRTKIQQELEKTLDLICSEGANLVNVFTTNYDSIVEEGLTLSEKYSYADGFAPRRGQAAIWNRRLFDDPKLLHGRKLVRLYKLHGSLNWRIEKDSGRIVRVETEERAANYSRRFGENILLYPASKRPPIVEPFGSLYSYLVRRLSNTKKCLAIGFSFRDPYINTVFVDYLRSNPENFVYVISPSATECSRNLLGPLATSILAKQVVTSSNKFGEPITRATIGAMIMSK